jgi:hypothetical protein
LLDEKKIIKCGKYNYKRIAKNPMYRAIITLVQGVLA